MARRRLVDHRISRVTIDGFKSIREQTVDLGGLNVFIGANGSGKTALLEAIGVLGAAAEGRVDDEELLRRGVRPGVPSLFKSAFEERRPRVIRLGATGPGGAKYAVALDNPADSPATPWRFMSESLRDGGETVVTRSPFGGNLRSETGARTRFKPEDAYLGLNRRPPPGVQSTIPLRWLNEALRDFVIYDPQTSVLRGLADPRTRDPLGLQGGRLAEAVEALLQERDGSLYFGSIPLHELFSLVEWGEHLDVSAPTPELLSPSLPAAAKIIRFTDRFMRKEHNRISAYDASEGALYVLFALALLFHPRAPRFFAIENIDHTLHPRLARALVRTMSAHLSGRQVLLTTHNPLVLDGLDLAQPDIRLFTVERTESGRTVVSRV